MARRMSCSLTIDAVRERRKTVTRRQVDTWTTLKAGDCLTLIEKGMGLPKGAKQVVLAEVEVTGRRHPDDTRTRRRPAHPLRRHLTGTQKARPHGNGDGPSVDPPGPNSPQETTP